MLSKVLYQTEATATGGRDGYARTRDGSLNVWLGLPHELGGKDVGNNPEQLFAAGYAACFLSAMKTVSSLSKGAHPKVPDSAKVTAQVGIGPRIEGGFGLAISLSVELPGIERAAAEALVATAHETCPYSNAVRGNIDVALQVI
ncbi:MULTISPECIES: organic hydroperoxide resistance protein [unclassified Paludibacterium]|uniref:organic hydroperoxide resistance protein n=1 Tax=unclassified Paludibacterium TaxID=2618429 RepID=UPI001C03A7DA|nr:organic hydroperoxide resistance protein [Paludibacterium sp. B53371]BEV72607.1 organic hydroperoxide resistance protein [Paludibacterium sp. THUN1379]